MQLKDVLKLPDQFWNELAAGSTESIQKWIERDALSGVMQDGTSNHTYKSNDYVRYKQNNMRKFGRGKKKKGKGDRLSAYKAESIQSNDTSKVNLTLTGKMLRGIKRGASPEPNTLVMVFNTIEDANKALGNKKYGYNIFGLNKSNKEKVKQRMLKEFKKNIFNITPKEIVIYIE